MAKHKDTRPVLHGAGRGGGAWGGNSLEPNESGHFKLSQVCAILEITPTALWEICRAYGITPMRVPRGSATAASIFTIHHLNAIHNAMNDAKQE